MTTIQFKHKEAKLSNYIIVKGRSETEVIDAFNDLEGSKKVMAAYGMNGRHYLVVYVDKKVKRISKKDIENGSIK